MTHEKLYSALSTLRTNPILHLEKIQGIDSLEDYQKKICTTVSKNERTVISACHCLGKTFIISRLVLWLGSCFKGAKIVTTAPTFSQVKHLLWSEIKTGFRQSHANLGGEMLDTFWKISDDWFAMGVSPKEDAGDGQTQGTDSRFQGIHGDLVVIIFDEATGVSNNRWLQAEGMLTSGKVKFIAIGNPTSRNSEFFRCFQSPEYAKIHLSCFDSPNVIANGIRNVPALRAELNYLRSLPEDKALQRIASYKIIQPKLLTLQWVVSRGLKWGLDHPLFLSKVLGRFPEEDENALIPLSLVEDSMNREGSHGDIRSIGVDPARFGTDSTVITRIEGNEVVERKEINKMDTAEVTGIIVRMVNNLPRKRNEIIVVDATGIGAGVYDQLRERRDQQIIPESIRLREAHFGSQCDHDEDKKQFVNLKSKIFVDLAEDLKADLVLPRESIYLEELPTLVYKFDSKGRWVMESKDEYKKRTGRGSPDSADSLALANFGRHDSKRIGNFSDSFVEKTQDFDHIGTIAPSMNSDRW